MKAAYVTSLDKTNDPLTHLEIGDRPEPKPEPGQALVRVTSVSLNHHDLWTLKGIVGTPITLPRILGCEASGIIEAYEGQQPQSAPAVGSEVVLYPVIGGEHGTYMGEDVLFSREFGMLSDRVDGTFAGHVVLPAENVLPRPNRLSVEEVSCLGVTYLTAFRMLFTRARLQAGNSVLVQGAGGGVATAAIQLAQAAGITVFAASRDGQKLEHARGLGAHHLLEAGSPVAKQVLTLTNGRGVDAVIETVGEPTWKESIKAVRPGGSIVVAGATGGANPGADLNRVFWRQISIIGSTMGTFGEFQRLLRFVESADIHPTVDSMYSLDDLPKAIEKMQAGNIRGKIVIKVS